LTSRQAVLDEHGKRNRLTGHVIIVGYGVNGQNVARVLVETGIPFMILEADGAMVRRARNNGPFVLFGDATRKDILTRADIESARLLVVAISDPLATRSIVGLARLLHPSLYIIVRTRSVQDVEELTRLGANEVIPEEFETSIEIFTRVLDRFHIPRNIINAQIKVIRDENYAMLRGLPQSAQGLERMTQILSAGTSDTFLVTGGTIAEGISIAELALTEKTGVLLIAVVRGDTPQLTPGPAFVMQAGDSLVLVGTHAAMDSAFDYLSTASCPK
jgi:CPA2 family monovalent cation:H+ antiporter-2